MSDSFQFSIKESDKLSDNEKEQLMKLSVETYPAFEKYYRVNKYYSTIRPQMVGIITNDSKIVGTGKFLWRDIDIGGLNLKFFGLGVLIAEGFRQKGLATQLVRQFITKAEEEGGDFLYATSDNPVIDRMLTKLGFRVLRVPIEYSDVESGRLVKQEAAAYAYELRSGVLSKLEALPSLHIGTGPI